jgi:hypothetical protein
MPQEGITVQEYEEAIAKLGKFDWTNFESDEMPANEEDKFCSGGVCTIGPR